MQTLAQQGLTTAQVIAQLQAQTNEMQWKYDRLSVGLVPLSDLSSYVLNNYNGAPKIDYDTTSGVKRQMTLDLRGDNPIAPRSDLIRVRFQLWSTVLKAWLEWPLGVFCTYEPKKMIFPGRTIQTFTCYDLTMLLNDTGLQDALSYTAGTSAMSAVTQTVGLFASQGGRTPLNVSMPGLAQVKLSQPLSWRLGDSLLKVINDILDACAWLPCWADENGLLKSAPIPDDSKTPAAYLFDTTQPGHLVLMPIEEDPDPSQSGNVQVVRVEDPKRTPFTQIYTNTNPASPVSVPNWRPKMLPVISDSSIVDATAAQTRATRAGQAAGRLFVVTKVSTPPWPFSQNRDVFNMIINTSMEGLRDDNYLEQKWSHYCSAGQPTTHEWYRIVPTT